MASQFDKEGRYFAELTEDGKLKIWNTASNQFEQEYVPDLHLTSPCTCLQFVDCFLRKNGSPRKKKKRNSISDQSTEIALGTTAGTLIIYSIAKSDVSHIIDGNINLQINCLSVNIEEVLYSGVEENIIAWDIQQRTVLTKWKSGNDRISAILAIPNTRKLLTASKSIKLWDLQSKTLLKTFSGHSSEVHLFQPILNDDSLEPRYVVSGSKGDRLLNCWNIDEDIKDGHATVSLLMEDTVRNICVYVSSDGSTKLAASVRSGIVHIFRLVLNGKSSKPIKPKSTIQVVSDTGQKEDVITSIPIVSSFFKDENSLLIAHGNSVVWTFENVELISKKLICLLRVNPLAAKSAEARKSKVLTPIIGNDVHYVTPFNDVGTTTKRKADGKLEVPMEKRLENLTINRLEDGKLPKSDNMAQLLLQGLRSKDQNIIKAVLCRSDEQIIKNTVKRLPLKVISELVKELTKFIKGKTVSSHIGALWLKHLIQTHAALLISNPDLPDLFDPMLSTIESRLTLQSRLSRLRGRLDLLVSQVSASSHDDNEEDEEAMLIFNDKDSSGSDAEIDMEDLNSASENEWSEEESSDEDMVENDNKSVESDEEMST